MTHTTESEFKLRAQQPIETAAIDALLRELDAPCRFHAERRHTDTYLDDDLGSLLRAGVGVRLRAGGGKRVLTCKMQRKDDGRLFVRDELEAPWPNEELPGRAADLPDALREAVQPLVGDRALRPQQTLQVHREIRMVTDGERDLCELAIDFVDAHANGHTVSFQEIELEVVNDLERNERLAQQLHERLPVQFASQDKPKYAAALLGIEAPIERGAEELALQPVREAIVAQLEQLQACIGEFEQAVRDVGHHRTIADMQTAITRQEALLAAFADLWPEPAAERMRTYLRTTHRHLGAVAELHTLLDGLRQHADRLPEPLLAANQEVVAAIEQERDLAMDRLSAWLGNEQRTKTTAEFATDVRNTSEANDTSALLHAAPTAVLAAATELRAQLEATGDELTTAEATALRAPMQRMHHLAEQFADLPDANYKKSIKAVAKALRHVTRVCDAEAIVAKLMEWIESPPAGAIQPGHAAVFGAFATLLTETAREARGVAREVTERLDKKSVWQRFGAR